MGFHAPQEAARTLGEAIDFARQGQLAASLPRGGAAPPAPAASGAPAAPASAAASASAAAPASAAASAAPKR